MQIIVLSLQEINWSAPVTSNGQWQILEKVQIFFRYRFRIKLTQCVFIQINNSVKLHRHIKQLEILKGKYKSNDYKINYYIFQYGFKSDSYQLNQNPFCTIFKNHVLYLCQTFVANKLELILEIFQFTISGKLYIKKCDT